MGLCNKRHFLLTVCTLQLITTVERQVFDFLGFMWLPILFNFFNIIFVIFGFFGAFQYRPKYIIAYSVWNVWWLGWNIFVTCFYLNAGKLDRDSDLLNFGTNSFSWWYVNGPGCKAHYNNTLPEVDRPDVVTDCVLNYEIVEVIHSSIQCLLAVMAIIGGIILSRVFMEEDDSSTLRKKKKTQNPIRPIYSIEYSQPEPPSHVNHEDRMSPKPMTPRRVKRRSVISRDQGMRRSSRRSSVRQSRRKSQSSNRMSDQDGLYANSSNFANQNMNSISQGQLNYDRISGRWERVDRNSIITVNPGWQGSNMNMNMNMNMNLAAASSSPNIWQPTTPVYPSMPSIPVPNRWENASSTRNLTDNMAVSMNPLPMHGQWQGQSNPSFQQTSIQSLNQEDMDEIYNNRPASVRSIYSNYHGVRATPQVPARSDQVRQSQRQFVLSGPPAYQDTVI
ncbi:sodium/potassium-transporting ATPase subunit beta-1-interacting protein isoform X2 [Trichogramma pretiosum]|uniref:sodium/potassium-transporting ATPase subunit beta-1-interacting protein isoform X2 n=1 Tax=Trichogramma pretiosum TaxID=7493 RepID=UPI0006C98EC4|nr:sodium/potassium-transporting ATPase subunit beta-1-interacting protein isoform X2 [Trichogramma pretiosum]